MLWPWTPLPMLVCTVRVSLRGQQLRIFSMHMLELFYYIEAFVTLLQLQGLTRKPLVPAPLHNRAHSRDCQSDGESERGQEGCECVCVCVCGDREMCLTKSILRC